MAEETNTEKSRGVSRRTFLVNAGRFATVAAVGTASLSWMSCSGSEPVAAEPTATTLVATATTAPSAAATAAPTAAPTSNAALTVPEWPWPYVKLDPQEVAERGYKSYYEAGCAYGAFNGIISALQEKAGQPFTLIPAQMLRYGEGGVVGWASLCGSLNGSAAAINLVSKDYKDLVNELMGWYTITSFPNFKPSNPKVDIEATSVSGSPLCHVSVTEWCKAADAKSESPERSERCGRLTGEVAARAVEILNQYATGDFKPAFALAPSINECGACHLKGGTLENARGKMDCVQCHEPHE